MDERFGMKPVEVDHNAYLVQKGMLEIAEEFFAQMGWWLVRNTGVQSWGQAIFVTNGSHIIQLSEYYDFPGGLTGDHLGLKVNPAVFTQFASEWGEYDVEDVGAGKVMLSIPSIFAFDFELVPPQYK